MTEPLPHSRFADLIPPGADGLSVISVVSSLFSLSSRGGAERHDEIRRPTPQLPAPPQASKRPGREEGRRLASLLHPAGVVMGWGWWW